MNKDEVYEIAKKATDNLNNKVEKKKEKHHKKLVKFVNRFCKKMERKVSRSAKRGKFALETTELQFQTQFDRTQARNLIQRHFSEKGFMCFPVQDEEIYAEYGSSRRIQVVQFKICWL